MSLIYLFILASHLICPLWTGAARNNSDSGEDVFLVSRLLRAACCTVRPLPSIWVQLNCLHILLGIQVPCCAVKGQHKPLHCWHDFSAARVFVLLSSHVTYPIEDLVFLLMWKCGGHWRTREKQDSIVVRLCRNWTPNGAAVAIATGRWKPPIPKGLNWVPALNTRRWMDDRSERDRTRKKERDEWFKLCQSLVCLDSELCSPFWTTFP